jgi:Cyclin-dependent kinase inhibitor
MFFRHAKATGSESKASSQWEFDFELGKPAKYHRNYKWEAMPCDEVPKVYRVNHIKRLYSVTQNKNFEGQLPKLRYYHHIKKVEPQEENNNKVVSVMEQPITASSKKNGSTGQMKITGKTHYYDEFLCV